MSDRRQSLPVLIDPNEVMGIRAALPGLRFIGTFRHPSAVAQSLHRRGKMSRRSRSFYSSVN